MEHGALLILLAIIFAFFMAWGVGANDVANAIGTSVGSKAITVAQAILIAAVFESLGAILAGGQVTGTISKGIIPPEIFSHQPQILVYGMLAALLATGSWLLIATCFGWPVSTTHSIIGAIIGFAVFCTPLHAIKWIMIVNIVLSWIITPVLSGLIAFLLFKSVQRFIFDSHTPLKQAKKIVPIYISLVTFVISIVTIISGLKHINLPFNLFEEVSASILISIIGGLIGLIGLRQIRLPDEGHPRLNTPLLEKIFAVLMVFTACAMAFAHGSNDVANAIGPLAAVINLVQNHGIISQTNPLPLWIMPFGALGIVTGLAMYGHKVIATVGSEITQLTPSRGFAAQLATASTVILASGFGLPISTTQTLVGGVLGVGLARGIGAINLKVVRNILASWLVTVPAGAVLSAIYFFVLKTILN